jgi:dimethylglycine dehydrogenase
MGRELSPEYSALESGLQRFVRLEKPDFIGRAALLARQSQPQSNSLVTLKVNGVTDADARGSEPVLHAGRMIGRTSSGGYGWRIGQSLALAMVPPEFSEIGTQLQIVILGQPHDCEVVPESPYDPKNLRLKS